LKRFLPRYRADDVKIYFFPEELLNNLKSLQYDKNPTGAVFICPQDKYDKKTILIDGTDKLAVLVPFLFHEIVHYLDDEYVDKIQSSCWNKYEARKHYIIEAEKHAFSMQHKLLQELNTKFPDYISLLKYSYPNCSVLHEELSDKDVELLYDKVA